MRCNKILDKNNDSDGNNTHSCLRTKRLWRLLESLTVPASLTKYVKGLARRTTKWMEGVQMVMHLLTEELSVQVSWITTFMFLRLGHVHAHVTPPHSSLLDKCSSRAHEIAKTITKITRTAPYMCLWRKLKPANQLHLRTTINKQVLPTWSKLSSNHSSRHTSCPIQTKYPSISSIFVFLAQP